MVAWGAFVVILGTGQLLTGNWIVVGVAALVATLMAARWQDPRIQANLRRHFGQYWNMTRAAQALFLVLWLGVALAMGLQLGPELIAAGVMIALILIQPKLARPTPS